MDVGKSSSWPPGPTVCRCCLAEGCYKDISTEYFWMGKREVYAEMLTETFDLAISYAQSAGTNSNSRLICEPCISRLRDASEFKRQVSECERMFTTLLEPGSSGQSGMAQVTLSRLGKDVKVERVKVKKEDSEDDDDDDMFAEPFGDDDDDDDADDEPLTNLATKIPKKEAEDDIFGSEDKPKPAEKRKATVKAKAVPAKKAKATVTKAKGPAAKVAKPQEKKKRGETEETESSEAWINAAIILKHSTAYPFQLFGSSIKCCFCKLTFDEPSIFRKHVDSIHRLVDRCRAMHRRLSLKIDITDLQCTTCTAAFESLDLLTVHLKNEHNYDIKTVSTSKLVPIRLAPDRHTCVFCEKNFSGLRELYRHSGSHFSRYQCQTCGKGYESKNSLTMHILNKHSNSELKFFCSSCKQRFPSTAAKRKHFEESKKCMTFSCPFCEERFMFWEARERHLVAEHGKAKQTFPCKECKEVFPTRHSLYTHFKAKHTHGHVCQHCGKRYSMKAKFEEHLLTHSGEKPHKCALCEKTFHTKKHLSGHIQTHCDTKSCPICNKVLSFRYLRDHAKQFHPESYKTGLFK
ncbi:zinc finger protein 652-A isoform X21 [Plutella xylostella]|uniref:zinc finger protein 652-A isoform X21 n=1 Tax=Plutella xylostella TaxID=51655 RepID=UPI002032C8CB|nr:zinc finger protein 652-A isoform X21 [Plutella xylostella]